MASCLQEMVHSDIKAAMRMGSQQLLVLVFLIPTIICGRGAIASRQNEIWPCVCGTNGLIGTQLYTGNENVGFTECNCPSPTGGCFVCPAGQILEPSKDHNQSCHCKSPLFVKIRFVQMNLLNYTPSLERAFIEELASYLVLSPSQIIPSTRRRGSVIVDLYIFADSEDQAALDNVGYQLLQRNNTQDGGTPWDKSVGVWSLLYAGNISSNSVQGPHWKNNDGKQYLLVTVLCGAIAVALLLVSLSFLLYNKRKRTKPAALWFDDDNSSSGFRTLLSHRSSPTKNFQVYDNTCFNGSTGCIGRRSFRISSKMGPFLGMVTRQFTFLELQEATGTFSNSNLIGVGGSSTVYKGCLKDGRDVAIKKLNTKGGQDLDREFLLELELLSRLHHFHLVPLVGFCIETRREAERLLVYEYMPNGNLREHLNQPLGKENLDWATRVRIALGAARGLEYLHEAADPRVLHRDFKSSNILLDSKWRARVADFGMATVVKEVDANACPTSPAQMLGTFGYFAPEYAMTGRATAKSDVFSFGVVLLELISGRKPVEKNVPLGQESLVVWALPLLRNGTRLVNELLDPVLKQDLPVDDVQKMAHLAWLCLQMDPESRPTMTVVVQVLATFVPEKSVRMTEFGLKGHQVPEMFSWAHDYSFSRDVTSSPAVPSNSLDQCRQPSHYLSERQITPFDDPRYLSDRQIMRFDDGELEIIAHSKKGEESRKSLTSTSLSAAEYLEKFTAMTSVDEMRKSSEEEADLVKPRLEYFWLNNGLLVQKQSPSR